MRVAGSSTDQRTRSVWVWCSIAAALALGVLSTGALAQRESAVVRQLHLRIDTPWGNQRVLVLIPRSRLEPEAQWPVLVALHGMGEARRGPERGFLGWAVDYQLPNAFAALQRGRLTERDYGGFVRVRHLRAVNAELDRRAFEGLIVVCPYTPDLMGQRSETTRMRWGEWVAGPLLARVRAELPDSASTDRQGTGIDGVSLGGLLSLEVGLRHPEAFGAVGAIQPAIRGREDALAALATSEQHIHLLSSEDDPFLQATRSLSERLRERRIGHVLSVLPGPHDYGFNRGPGGIEMLRFHDRALRSSTE